MKCWSEIGDAVVDLRNSIDRENRGMRAVSLFDREIRQDSHPDSHTEKNKG